MHARRLRHVEVIDVQGNTQFSGRFRCPPGVAVSERERCPMSSWGQDQAGDGTSGAVLKITPYKVLTALIGAILRRHVVTAVQAEAEGDSCQLRWKPGEDTSRA